MSDVRMVNLGDIAELFNGKTPSRADQRDTGYPVLKIRDIDASGKFCGSYGSFVDSSYVQKLEKKLAQPKDIVILNAAHSSTHVGSKIAQLSYEVEGSLLTGEWLVIRVDPELAYPDYVYFFISSKRFKENIKKATKGIHLYPKFLSRELVLLPPLEEQKSIVEALSKIKSIQEAREHQLTTLDELLISFFKDSFHAEDYPHKPLKEIATVLSGGTPRSSVQEYWNGNIEWVTPADLGQHEGIYFSSSSRKITDTGLKNSSAVLLPIGSVMMSSRAPIGHLAINTVPMATNQGFKSIVPGEEITNLYLLFWFKSHMTYIQNLGVGATFKEISKKVVENIKVPVPPIAEQERFSQKVSKIISQQTLIHKSLENDNSLFLSIQSKFFNY